MSLKILKSFQLDFAKSPPIDYIFAKQGDQESRILEITPLNNGVVYTIPEGTTARFGAKKPDGTQILNDAVIESGKIYVTLSAQALAVSGVVTAEIALYGSPDELLSSQHFHIMVERFAVDPDAVESSDDYQSFETALLRLEPAIQAAENINITEEETASGYTITITDRDGESSTVDIETSGASVIANPELEGREDTLASIEIDDTKYIVDNFIPSVPTNDKTPYLFRTSGGGVDIGNKKTIKNIVGGTVVWNQLVNTTDTSVTVPNSHKYIAKTNGTWSFGTSAGSALAVSGASGDNVFDITLMFGSAVANYVSTLETANSGSGISWLKSYGFFAKPYYSYNSGQLMSVKMSANVMIGFNQFDGELENGRININTGALTDDNNRKRSKNYIPVAASAVYYINLNGTVCYYGSDQSFIGYVSTSSSNRTFTPPENTRYIKFYASNGVIPEDDKVNINLHWDGERDGEYEPYIKYEYALDSALELRGIPKLDNNNDLYYDGDTYEPDGAVKRKYAVLTNQSGTAGSTITLPGCDTSAADVITSAGHLADIGALSGTTLTLTAALLNADIIYPLSAPVTETADSYADHMTVNDWGTEEFVDTRNVAIPVGHDTEYPANLKAKLEMSPNSPDNDGLYLVQHLNGINKYIQYISPVPDLPSSNGTYVLKCTVSGGTKTASWVSAT